MEISNKMEEKENIGKKLFVNHKRVRIETLEVDGEKYEFSFKKLSWDETLRIQNDAVSMLPDGSMEIDLLETTYKMALAALVKAPFEITRENLVELDEEVGSWLEKQLNVKSFRKNK